MFLVKTSWHVFLAYYGEFSFAGGCFKVDPLNDGFNPIIAASRGDLGLYIYIS